MNLHRTVLCCAAKKKCFKKYNASILIHPVTSKPKNIWKKLQTDDLNAPHVRPGRGHQLMVRAVRYSAAASCTADNFAFELNNFAVPI